MANDVYEFEVKSIKGESYSLENYRGKVILIVNTASKCGYTYQYKGLQKLYDQFKEQDFVVLGFPCNQFKHQEPGDDEAIASFCQLNHGEPSHRRRGAFSSV